MSVDNNFRIALFKVVKQMKPIMKFWLQMSFRRTTPRLPGDLRASSYVPLTAR